MVDKEIIPNFPDRTLGDIWYNLKKSLKNLKRFFWVVWTYREMDYKYTLEILKVSLEGHLNALKNDSWEVEEDRLPKIVKLERALELLDNKLADNYIERCGYDWDYNIKFIPVEDEPDYSEMVDDKTEDQIINNNRAVLEANKLEKSEWREFIEIIHDDFNGWWV